MNCQTCFHDLLRLVNETGLSVKQLTFQFHLQMQTRQLSLNFVKSALSNSTSQLTPQIILFPQLYFTRLSALGFLRICTLEMIIFITILGYYY